MKSRKLHHEHIKPSHPPGQSWRAIRSLAAIQPHRIRSRTKRKPSGTTTNRPMHLTSVTQLFHANLSLRVDTGIDISPFRLSHRYSTSHSANKRENESGLYTQWLISDSLHSHGKSITLTNINFIIQILFVEGFCQGYFLFDYSTNGNIESMGEGCGDIYLLYWEKLRASRQIRWWSDTFLIRI